MPVIALFILPLSGSHMAANPNEVARIELTTSIAMLARLDIGDAATVYGLSEDVSERHGRIFCDKAPGLSIAAVPALWIVNPILPRAGVSDLPAYWPLRHLLTLLLVALPTLGLAVLIGHSAIPADPDRRRAAAIIAALATPLWTYGTVFFGHAPSALLVTAAWCLLIGFPGHSRLLDARRAALGGAAAGFAVATEYPTAILVAVIFGVLIVRRTALPILVSAFAGALFGALPALLYHQLAFGAPWTTGYSLKMQADFQAIHGRGVLGVSWPSFTSLWGVLFSARRGMIYYCPVLLLTPLGLFWTIRRRGWREGGPLVVALATYTLFAAGFVDWTAGWCAAARHLVPIVPLALVPALAVAMELAGQRWGAAVVVFLTAVSATNTVLSVVLTPFFPPEFGAPLAQLVVPSLADGVAFPNLVSSWLGVPSIVVAMLTAAAALGVMLWAQAALIARAVRFAALFVATAAVVVMGYSWQGAHPSVETELMRAQVLRRLGHETTADTIEMSSIPAERSGGD